MPKQIFNEFFVLLWFIYSHTVDKGAPISYHNLVTSGIIRDKDALDYYLDKLQGARLINKTFVGGVGHCYVVFNEYLDFCEVLNMIKNRIYD